MAALALFVVVAAIAGGIWFFLQQRKCATLACLKKDSVSTSTAVAGSSPRSSAPNVSGGVRQRPPKPTELDQRDLFAEFMEKEALANPSPAHTPRKGSSEKKKVETPSAPASEEASQPATVAETKTPETPATAPVSEAPTQMSELSAATPAITPLPSSGNTPTKDVLTAVQLPTPTGEAAPSSVKRPSKISAGGVDEPTVNETASKKKTKKKKRGSRMLASKSATASAKSKKSMKSKKGKKKSATK